MGLGSGPDLESDTEAPPEEPPYLSRHVGSPRREAPDAVFGAAVITVDLYSSSSESVISAISFRAFKHQACLSVVPSSSTVHGCSIGVGGNGLITSGKSEMQTARRSHPSTAYSCTYASWRFR